MGMARRVSDAQSDIEPYIHRVDARRRCERRDRPRRFGTSAGPRPQADRTAGRAFGRNGEVDSLGQEGGCTVVDPWRQQSTVDAQAGQTCPECPPRARRRGCTLDGVFERFTDRARSVLVLAQEEARLLNHSFIGTEHILLGLIREGEGVGARALQSLGINLQAVQVKVEETIGMAGTPPSGSPPFTPRAKKVLELSFREALQLGHSYIGTEHILLGLVREGEGVAATVLVGLGADLGRVRQKVMQLMSGASEEEHSGDFEPVHSTAASSEPRCPRCRTGLVEGARFRTIDVPPDQDDDQIEAISIDVVYCSGCGMTLHMFTSDYVAARQVQRQIEPPGRGASTQNLRVRPKPPRIEQTGPPPEDEAAARGAISRAFADMGEVDEDKGTVPSVEDSDGLAVCREQATELARTRFGGQVPDVTVAFVVETISFVNDHEAIVTYTAQVTGSLTITLGNRPGRAVLVDGEWKVTRETFCAWVSVSGVQCPPRKGR